MDSDDPYVLPKFDDPRIEKLHWGSEKRRAYDTILEAESFAANQVKEAKNIKLMKDKGPAIHLANEKLISARVAGNLFIEFQAQANVFSLTPGDTLVKWILSDPRDPLDNKHDVVINNGRNLRDNFIRTFRTSNIRYPLPSSHPSQLPFDDLVALNEYSMMSTGNSYKTSRKRALARDGYRCIVTGILDRKSVEHCPELYIPNISQWTLEMAHIFNESTTQGIEPMITEEDNNPLVYNKTYHTATALSILESFGFSKFADTFKNTHGVHQVWNLITLEYNLRTLFDGLGMWFEPTETPHRYQVHTLKDFDMQFIRNSFVGHDREIEGAPEFVEFNSQNKKAPPPEPLLLALHGLCARVAHMSGAAEFFDRLEWDVEETKTLASDGSSGPLLHQLLTPYVDMIQAVA